MAKKPLPTPDELRQLLDYDPETGVLTWRERPLEMFAKARIGRTWNTRFANKPAGCIGAYGYVFVEVHGSRPIGAHRAAWAIVYGKWPTEIDHINGNPADNRLANLREVSHAENQKNLRRGTGNTTGVVGVSFHKRTGKFRAYIGSRGNWRSLGHYATLAEAASARKRAEAKLGYHKNHGREA